MAITKSAKKALRQNIKRKRGNIKKKKKMRTLVKEARVLISQKKSGEAEKLLPEIYKSLDKAAKTNVIKKNAASRKKSRISKAINSVKIKNKKNIR